MMNFEDSFKIILKTYNYHLRTNPLLTKSVTSGILGFAGAAVAAKLRETKNEDLLKNTGPLTVFGLCFAGPITHHLYNLLEVFLKGNTNGKILAERLVFAPLFMVLTLYVLERLKGSSHHEAFVKLKANYLSALFGNWKIWTVPQLINLSVVPVEYRVLFANMVAFFWNIYLANKTAPLVKSVKSL